MPPSSSHDLPPCARRTAAACCLPNEDTAKTLLGKSSLARGGHQKNAQLNPASVDRLVLSLKSLWLVQYMYQRDKTRISLRAVTKLKAL